MPALLSLPTDFPVRRLVNRRLQWLVVLAMTGVLLNSFPTSSRTNVVLSHLPSSRPIAGRWPQHGAGLMGRGHDRRASCLARTSVGLGRDDLCLRALTPEERSILTHSSVRGDKRIYVASDSTGETAKLLVARLLVQYPDFQPEVILRSSIRTADQIAELMADARDSPADTLVFGTFVNPTMSRWVDRLSEEMGVRHINVMEPLLTQLNTFLQQEAAGQPGDPAAHVDRGRVAERVNDAFFGMVDAVKFAQQHVSGLNSRGWGDADVVLVGPSRVGKAANAYMLSERGVKVACVDLTPEGGLPPELSQVEPSKILPLLMEEDALLRRRQNRVAHLRESNLMGLLDDNYASLERVQEETRFVSDLVDAHPHWLAPVDCTGLAVEDSSAQIARLVRRTKVRK